MKLIRVETNIVASLPDTEPYEGLKIHFGETAEILYVPDQTPLETNEDQFTKDPRLLMTEEAVRSCRKDDIDNKTDYIIATGFIYPSTDIRFKMDIEHQMSYKSVYDLHSFLTFPYTIKGVGSGYLAFQNESEMAQFILYSFGWIREIILVGWTLKDGLDELNKQELIAWIDPR